MSVEFITGGAILFPRFRQRVRSLPGVGAVWEEGPNEFDAALHFHRFALPAPGDRRALQDLVSDLVSRPLDPDRPLWDLIADGISLAR